ncbi:hypothetical protein ACFYKX_15580 [Cytobacillus sp. FJAT-54145]|uniref:Uncharacterized protein n=1 Tax=Cytobacillus spartinae TaxID=3299023 RepID=A0ABW6KH51_9BACI
MNIQQFYQQAANVSLNASLASFIPPIIILTLGVLVLPNGNIILFILPFLLYSFFCYQSYLLNKERSLGIHPYHLVKELEFTSLLDQQNLLFSFMPAPSLRMVFFHTTGQYGGELKDVEYSGYRWFLPYFADKRLPRNYGLYNDQQQLLATFKRKGRKMIVMDSEEERIITLLWSNHKVCLIEPSHTKIEIDSAALYIDSKYYNEQGSMIARVRKGLMPLEWGKVFKDSNTPVLSFDKDTTLQEKMIIFSSLIFQYSYSNH